MAKTPSFSRRLARSFVALAACALLLALAATPSLASEFGPLPPANPYTAANGAATMHADSESSNASPYPGPGPGTLLAVPNELAAACPTVLQGSDGMPVALCTSILGRNPTVYLLNPSTGTPLASLKLAAGNLLGGVYAYMDDAAGSCCSTRAVRTIVLGHRRLGFLLLPRPGPRLIFSIESVAFGRVGPDSAYLICSTQRSGSTYLCELLASTGVAGCPEEFFEARAETGLP